MGAFSYISDAKTITIDVGPSGPRNMRALHRAAMLLDPYCTTSLVTGLLGKTKRQVSSSDAREPVRDLMIAVNFAKRRAMRGQEAKISLIAVLRYSNPHTTILSIVSRVAVDKKEGVRLSRKARQLGSDAKGANGTSAHADVVLDLACDGEVPHWEWIDLQGASDTIPMEEARLLFPEICFDPRWGLDQSEPSGTD